MKQKLILTLLLSMGVCLSQAQSQSEYSGYLENALEAAKKGDEQRFQTNLRYFSAALQRSHITPQSLNTRNQELYRDAMYEGAVKRFTFSRAQYDQLLAFLRYDPDDPANMTSLGYLYEQGIGVNQDQAEAARWYRRAAEERKRREEEERKRIEAQAFARVFSDIAANMVYVQGGTYSMGSNNGDSDEKPVHSVTLNSYSIGKYPVTVKEFKAFLKDSGYAYGDNPGSNDDHPAVNINYSDAVAYCNWLSRKTAKTYRLPTEAEWEYAARGGSRSRGYTYSGSNDIDAVAWYGGGSTQAVGRKAANELGLYDMSGHVWEWCSDWYGDYPSGSVTNPKGPGGGSNRVLRGGSWGRSAELCRVANRSRLTPGHRNNNYGFRVVSQ